MGYAYRVATANCGNSGLGKKATQLICRQVVEEGLDFFVINCQEVDFKKARMQLQKELPIGYALMQSDAMPTHTKAKTQYNENYGMISFIIYKLDTIVLTKSEPGIIARRKETRGGSAYNKGGLVSEFQMEKKNEKPIQIKTVSGHLESFNEAERSTDWKNINLALSAPQVNTWDQLLDEMSHLVLSGYDANTRNVIKSNKVVNLWQTSPNDPSIQAIHQVPIGSDLYSGSSTYKTYKDPAKGTKDKHRKGYANYGSVDFVGVSDGGLGNSSEIINDVSERANPLGGYQIKAVIDEGRDHDIVVSPQQRYKPLNDYERVRRQIVSRIAMVAPDLAKDILVELQDDTPVNRKKLVWIYQAFLSPDGLLNKGIDLHVKKQGVLEHVNKNNLLKSKRGKQDFNAHLFSDTAWFKEIRLDAFINDKSPAVLKMGYAKKKAHIETMLPLLKKSSTEAELLTRVELEQKFIKGMVDPEIGEEQLLQNEKTYLREQFNSKYTEYSKLLDSYRDKFNKDDSKRPFLIASQSLLGQIQADFKENNNLHLGCAILDQCIQLTEAVASNKQKEVKFLAKEMVIISQEMVGKKSNLSNALKNGLQIVACLALVAVAVIAFVPTFGISSVAVMFGVIGVLDAILDITSQYDKSKLEESVAVYKSVFDAIETEEEELTRGMELKRF